MNNTNIDNYFHTTSEDAIQIDPSFSQNVLNNAEACRKLIESKLYACLIYE